jgi:hypothetical protein
MGQGGGSGGSPAGAWRGLVERALGQSWLLIRRSLVRALVDGVVQMGHDNSCLSNPSWERLLQTVHYDWQISSQGSKR